MKSESAYNAPWRNKVFRHRQVPNTRQKLPSIDSRFWPLRSLCINWVSYLVPVYNEICTSDGKDEWFSHSWPYSLFYLGVELVRFDIPSALPCLIVLPSAFTQFSGSGQWHSVIFCRIVWVQLMFAATHSIFGPSLRYIYGCAFFTARPNNAPNIIRQTEK